jgi:hypothetical protein
MHSLCQMTKRLSCPAKILFASEEKNHLCHDMKVRIEDMSRGPIGEINAEGLRVNILAGVDEPIDALVYVSCEELERFVADVAKAGMVDLELIKELAEDS